MSLPTWKDALRDHMPEDLAKEIEVFELQLQRRKLVLMLGQMPLSYKHILLTQLH